MKTSSTTLFFSGLILTFSHGQDAKGAESVILNPEKTYPVLTRTSVLDAPLTTIMQRPFEDITKDLTTYLVTNQGDPNLIDNEEGGYRQSLLQWCVYKNLDTIIDRLIENPRTDLLYRDTQGHNSLYTTLADDANQNPTLASKRYHIGQRILTRIPEQARLGFINQPDRRGLTTLHMTAYQDFREATRLCLTYGANPNTVDNNQRTPLHMACYKGHDVIIDLLLDYKADPTFRDKDGLSPYHYYVLGEQTQHIVRNPHSINRLEQALYKTYYDTFNEDPSLSLFLKTYERKLGNIFLAYRTIESGAIDPSKPSLSFSNLITLLGNEIIIPGAALATTIIASGVQYIEETLEEKKRRTLTELFSTVQAMEEAVHTCVLHITDTYKDNIKRLTPESAQALAEIAVARFIVFMRRSDVSLDDSRSLQEHALHALTLQDNWCSLFVKGFTEPCLSLKDGTTTWTSDHIFQKTTPLHMLTVPTTSDSEPSVLDENPSISSRQVTSAPPRSTVSAPPPRSLLSFLSCCSVNEYDVINSTAPSNPNEKQPYKKPDLIIGSGF